MIMIWKQILVSHIKLIYELFRVLELMVFTQPHVLLILQSQLLPVLELLQIHRQTFQLKVGLVIVKRNYRNTIFRLKTVTICSLLYYLYVRYPPITRCPSYDSVSASPSRKNLLQFCDSFLEITDMKNTTSSDPSSQQSRLRSTRDLP